MVKHEVEFDVQDFGEQPNDFEHLNTAIQQLSNKTEKEFEEIKNEKWFTRVINLATFSKKKDIRMASQISNVSQAQDILIELMKNLSNKDVEIDQVLMNNVEDVEKLYGHTEKLAIKVQDLKKELVLGINQSKNINSLKKHEQEILAGTIQEAAEKFNEPSDEQKDFANNLFRYLDLDFVDVNLDKAVDNLDSFSSRKVIFQVLLEYGFLHSLNFDFKNEFEDFVDLFEIGNRTIREIKGSIESIYKLRGIDGFSWFADEDEVVFDLEFENLILDLDTSIQTEEHNQEEKKVKDVISDVEVDLNADKEEFSFEKLSIIDVDEEVVIENKIVDIDMILKIRGKLHFVNCDIKFKDDYTPILIEGGNLYFNHCNIRSLSQNPREKFSVGDTNAFGKIIFNNSYIDNGYKIIKSDDLDIYFYECMINMNYDEAIVCNNLYFDSTKVIIHEASESLKVSIFNYNYIQSLDSSFKYEGKKEDQDNLRVFESISKNDDLINSYFDNCSFNKLNYIFVPSMVSMEDSYHAEVKNCEFKECSTIMGIYNCLITESEFFECREILQNYNKIDKAKFINCHNIYVSDNVTVENSIFENSKDIISGSNIVIKSSTFNNCKSVTTLGDKIKLEACTFNECDTVLSFNNSSIYHTIFNDCGPLDLNDNNLIKNCEFINVEELTRDKGMHSTNIEDCQFKDIIIKGDESSPFNENSFLTFSYFDKKHVSSKVKNCLFENVKIEGNGYIINTKAYYNIKKPSLTIENCAFVDCVSNKELVSLEDVYFPRFSKKSKKVQIGVVLDSVGLN